MLSELHSRQLWLLKLVPTVPFGRWWCATVIFVVLAGMFHISGVFADEDLASPAWPAAWFFCAILAYIVPIFHYITQRTELAFAELVPQLLAERESIERWRERISRKTIRWVAQNLLLGFSLWLLQSWLLADGFSGMVEHCSSYGVSCTMTLAPLLVWLVTTTVIAGLVDNARLFRTLADRIRVDLLDTSTLNPFGRMAVSSTLVVIGAQALFPIMWLGASTNPWTTIPGLVATSLALIYLFLAPTLPVHRALSETKRRELQQLRSRIQDQRLQGQDAATDQSLTTLLVYRREVAAAAEWPFDISIVARFGLYLVIVPLTWIGAALIENLVNLFINQ